MSNSLTSGNCTMYADDTNVFLKNKCYEELYKIANQELINIDNWLSANRLILNTDKTHYMLFRTAKTKPPSNNLTLATRNNCVSQQSKTRFLGIIFQKHLSWKPHMKFILKKLCITYGTIKKISKYFDKYIILLLYNYLIISHIRYGIGTWYNGNKTTVQKIQQIVNKFIRMIFGLHHRASVTNIMKDNGIMTIDQINKLELCSFIYKYTKNLLPPCFFNLFQHNIVGNDSQVNTRS